MTSRNRAWADQRFAGNSLPVGTKLISNLLVNAHTVDTLTAVRIVLDVTVQYDPSLTVVDSLSVIDVGIGVSSVEAFATAGALPSPSAETEYPPRGWLYVASQPLWQQAESTGVLTSVARFQVDIRSMRKIDKGVLFVMFQNTNLIVGATCGVTGRARVLCLT